MADAGADTWRANEPLADKTSMGVGGSAALFCAIDGHSSAEAATALAAALARAARARLALCVLGGGTNVVFGDGPLALAVLQQRRRSLTMQRAADGSVSVVAEAGLPFDDLVLAATDAKLAGLECLSGIPGSVGAAPVQNIGAYGQSLADTLAGVWAMPVTGGPLTFLPAAELALGYRTSRLRQRANEFVVTAVALKLRQRAATVTHPQIAAALTQRRGGVALAAGETCEPSEVRAAVLAVRAAKGMLWPPPGPERPPGNVGSFFLNPTVDASTAATLAARWPDLPRYAGPGGVRLPAAWLIEAAGLTRGHVFAEAAGRVGLSPQHALALINRGQATGADVAAAAAVVVRRVAATFAVTLRPEACLVGFAEAAPSGPVD